MFITEAKAERPLRYETTRPVSGKPKPHPGPAYRGRRNSAPTRRPPPPTHINKKEIHSRTRPSHQDENLNQSEDSESSPNTQDQSDHVTADGDHVTPDLQKGGRDDDGNKGEQSPRETISVNVKKPLDPVDAFVEELRLMGEMEMDFKKSTFQLQKKLGLETDGFV